MQKIIPGQRVLKKFYIIFRNGESPTGELIYSTCKASVKLSAREKAVAKYGHYSIYDIWTEEEFKKSTLKALGAKFYEDITKPKYCKKKEALRWVN